MELLQSKKVLRLAEVDREEIKKPKTLTVNLSPEAREVIESLREDTGVPNTTAMERILEWFSKQDLRFRQAILLRSPASSQEMARMALEQMAGLAAMVGDKAAGTTLADQAVGELSRDDAAAAARAHIQQLLALVNSLDHRAALGEQKSKRQQAKGG